MSKKDEPPAIPLLLPELEGGDEDQGDLFALGRGEFCPPPKLDKKDAPVIGAFPSFGGDLEPGWGAPAPPPAVVRDDDIQDG